MRSGDPGFEVSPDGSGGSWAIGREAGLAWPKRGWGTDFSCFRMAIPELAGFTGRHVYMDADMLVRADVAELFELPSSKPFLCLSDSRTDVSVIDAGAIGQLPFWPRLAELKAKGWKMYFWVQFLLRHDLIDASLPDCWNSCDPWKFMSGPSDPGLAGTKLLHFTTVPTQPYRPYPTVKYHKHPWQSWVDEWNRLHEESLAGSV